MKLDMKVQGWLTVDGEAHVFLAGLPRSLCGHVLDATTTDRDKHHRPPVDDPGVCRNCWQLSDF